MKFVLIGFAIQLFVFCQFAEAAQPVLWSSLTKLSNVLKPLTTLCLSLEGTSTIYTTTTVTKTATSIVPGATITSTTTQQVVQAETDTFTTTQTVDQTTITTTTSLTTTDIGALDTSTTVIAVTQTYNWDGTIAAMKEKRHLSDKQRRRARLERRDVISSLFNLIASLDRTWLQAQCKQYIVKPATTTITSTVTNSATTTSTGANVNALVTTTTTSTSSTLTTVIDTETDVVVITDQETATATTNDGTSTTTQTVVASTVILCQDGGVTGSIYTAANGQEFTRLCNFNQPYYDISVTRGILEFDTCMEMCASYNSANGGGCVGVSYAGRDLACWLKYFQGTGYGTWDASWTSSAIIVGCDNIYPCGNP